MRTETFEKSLRNSFSLSSLWLTPPNTREPKKNNKTEKKSVQKKYPLHGKPIIYRDPFASVFANDEPQSFARIPDIDKDKVIIKPDFDQPLPEFEI